MISICIPIYNCDVRTLVNDLHLQSEQLAIDYEILLIDDKSDEDVKEKNRVLKKLPNVIYKELPRNIGRAAIRNLLAKESRYRYLIFMDCDAAVYNKDYIRRYAVCCSPNVVCCGGIKTRKPLDPKYLLRWKFSNSREEIDAKNRNLSSNNSFFSFNFLIDKNIFDFIHFDENIKGYGYEDTLLGIVLTQNNIPIRQIENKLIHTGIDDYATFIKKTQNGIKNLIEIQKNFKYPDLFTDSIKLLKLEKKISYYHLDSIIRLLFPYLKNILLRNLKSKNPSLFFFDLYRLGYLCSLRKKEQTAPNDISL